MSAPSTDPVVKLATTTQSRSHVGQAVPDDPGDGLEQVPQVPAFDETFM